MNKKQQIATKKTKDYWRKKYKESIGAIDMVTMVRECLCCNRLFEAEGIPDGVKYIRICFKCKYSDIQREEADRKSFHVARPYAYYSN